MSWVGTGAPLVVEDGTSPGEEEGPTAAETLQARRNAERMSPADRRYLAEVDRWAAGLVADLPSADGAKAFDPRELRDFHGRWTSGGGGGAATLDALKAEDVSTGADAERFLGQLGIEAHLGRRLEGAPDGPKGLRQICQAVEDMTRKFPSAFQPIEQNALSPEQSMLDPGSPPGRYRWGFHRVMAYSQLPETDRIRHLGEGAWAVTDSRSDGITIAINDISQSDLDNFAVDSTYAEIGFTAPATVEPYGRMVHELGHVIARLRMDSDLKALHEATDEVYPPRSDTYDARGRRHRVRSQNRMVMSDVSLYGSTGDPQEQFAELFATLNVPGGVEKVNTKAGQRRVLRMRKAINRLIAEEAGWRRHHDYPGEPII